MRSSLPGTGSGKILTELEYVKKIYPSDANFLLIRVDNADRMYDYLKAQNIIVRNRSTARGCENCLRITVGTAEENDRLLNAMRNYKPDR
jgi:histidinol-phosphate aminotransferase